MSSQTNTSAALDTDTITYWLTNEFAPASNTNRIGFPPSSKPTPPTQLTPKQAFSDFTAWRTGRHESWHQGFAKIPQDESDQFSQRKLELQMMFEVLNAHGKECSVACWLAFRLRNWAVEVRQISALSDKFVSSGQDQNEVPDKLIAVAESLKKTPLEEQSKALGQNNQTLGPDDGDEERFLSAGNNPMQAFMEFADMSVVLLTVSLSQWLSAGAL
ncbi:hypothetical protein Q7P35_007546 [Cladosporium inversicolor]